MNKRTRIPNRERSIEEIVALGYLTSPDGCWLWQGAINQYGYGTISIAGRTHMAHRLSYEAHIGPIPDGMDVDHTCWTHACGNPAHLRTATRKQNCENFSAPATVRSKTGVRGVVQNRGGTYDWAVRHNGKDYRGYGYQSLDEAASAVKEARLRLHSYNERDRLAS